MEIHERRCAAKGVRLLAMDGGLDHTPTDEFLRQMDTLFAEGATHIVLDLSRLTYASSLGLAALVRAHHHLATRGGRIAFAHLHSGVAPVLRTVHLARLFELFAPVDEAVQALAAAAGTSTETDKS